MKNLKDFITEKQNFLIKNKNVLKDYDHYDYHPKTKDELQDIIIDLLKKGETNLNCIDISNIKDMSYLFCNINENITVKDIDISNWDVSNVENMHAMFYSCEEFNSDLSIWDVSNVNDMNYMFDSCFNFNSDLSKWDVSNVTSMEDMFENCTEFSSDLSKWNVSNVTNMHSMFYGCTEFNADLSKWDISNVELMECMFNGCYTLEKNKLIPEWWED